MQGLECDIMQELIKKLFDFKSTVEDMRKEPDRYRNIIQKYAVDAGVGSPGTPDELAATAYTVAENTTLLIDEIDVDAEVETYVTLEVSVDNGSTWAVQRRWRLASKGHLPRSYRTPFSFTGTASGATATIVKMWFDQPSAGVMSAGWNGRLIES